MAHPVLDAIRDAQDHGFKVTHKNGKIQRSYPPFSEARTEIQHGHKKTHWIWYVWPSLQGVRTTRFPQFILPDVGIVCDYLCTPILAERLRDISGIAAAHMKDGIDPNMLFGRQAAYDFPKFKEAMTFFAVAAHLNGNMEQKQWLLEALLSTGADSLEPITLQVLMASDSATKTHYYKDSEICAAVTAVAGAYGSLRSPACQLATRSTEDAVSSISSTCFIIQNVGREDEHLYAEQFHVDCADDSQIVFALRSEDPFRSDDALWKIVPQEGCRFSIQSKSGENDCLCSADIDFDRAHEKRMIFSRDVGDMTNSTIILPLQQYRPNRSPLVRSTLGETTLQ
jgi:uncharacterized protein (DUF1810 family)